MKTPEVMNGTRAPLGMSSPPAVYRDLIITGSRVQEMPTKGAAGDVRAWDARTGKLVWTFHTIPQPGEADFGTLGRRQLEEPLGRQRLDVRRRRRQARHRLSAVRRADLRSLGRRPQGHEPVRQLDRRGRCGTGKYLWHFQTVHHDIWDVDLPTATLIDVRRGGRTIPAIAVMNKTAMMFILDRVTGKPLYDVREVPVPTDTDVAGRAALADPADAGDAAAARPTDL